MALITTGSIDNFNLKAKKTLKAASPVMGNIKTFAEATQVRRKTEQNAFEFATSADARGLGIKEIKLTEGFEGFLDKIFNPMNEIYFVAWCWDLSGKPVHQYPTAKEKPEDLLIRLKVGKVRKFIGQGINLFPKRKVTGGLAVRIQIWESEHEARTFGKALTKTANAVQKSELNNLLSLVSLASGVSGTTVTLIKEASIELAKVIGTILQGNSDDYVDFFEGYYDAETPWKAGLDKYKGNSSKITLQKF